MIQRLFSLMLLISIFSLLVVLFLHPINAITQDLGRHLKTGQLILTTTQVPKTNLFSYTYPDFPFINHHWFSEVAFALLYNTGGFPLLLLFMTFCAVFAFSLVFFSAYKQKSSLLALGITAVCSLGTLAERTDLRPEIFSFVFLSLFVTILYAYRQRFTYWILLLIPLLLLWVNMHIYFAVGILLLGLFFVDELVSQRKRLKNKHTLLLALVLLGSSGVILLNPNGLQGAVYPLHVFQNYGYSIEENQNIFFLEQLYPHATIHYFAISICILFASLLLSIKKTRLIDWLLAIVFTVLAMQAIRNFPLFVFATFLPFSRSLSYALSSIAKHFSLRPSVKQTLLYGTFLVISMFCLLQAKTALATKGIGLGVPGGASPAADFFLAHNLHGPLFNNFDIGSYLEYRLYPKERVFVDGRPEAYPATFFQKTYIPMQEDLSFFHTQENKYHFNTIFFAHTDQTPWAEMFLQHILDDPTWKPVYLDDSIIILVKNSPQNAPLIKKFGMDKANLSPRFVPKNDLQSLLRLANFYIKIGDTSHQVPILQQVLTLQPTFCPALSQLMLLYSQQNNPAAASYAQRYQAYCQ